MGKSLHVRGADLRRRTEALALQIISAVRLIRADPIGRLLADQLLRSGTSVGANYRSACRARSRREFIAKLGIALEEADEVIYWLRLLCRARMGPRNLLVELGRETEEITRILAASIITAKRGARSRQ